MGAVSKKPSPAEGGDGCHHYRRSFSINMKIGKGRKTFRNKVSPFSQEFVRKRKRMLQPFRTPCVQRSFLGRRRPFPAPSSQAFGRGFGGGRGAGFPPLPSLSTINRFKMVQGLVRWQGVWLSSLQNQHAQIMDGAGGTERRAPYCCTSRLRREAACKPRTSCRGPARPTRKTARDAALENPSNTPRPPGSRQQ